MHDIIDSLSPGAKLFARATDTKTRRIEVASAGVTYVPSALYSGSERKIDPPELQELMLSRYGGIKPTPAGNARLLIGDIIQSEYTPGDFVERSWMLYNLFFQGPFMIGTDCVIEGVQIDITNAYLWALSQPLPYGHLLFTRKDVDAIPDDQSGLGTVEIFDLYGLFHPDRKTTGSILFHGSLHTIRSAARLGLVRLQSGFQGWL